MVTLVIQNKWLQKLLLACIYISVTYIHRSKILPLIMIAFFQKKKYQTKSCHLTHTYPATPQTTAWIMMKLNIRSTTKASPIYFNTTFTLINTIYSNWVIISQLYFSIFFVLNLILSMAFYVTIIFTTVFLVLNLVKGAPQVPCYFIFGDSLLDNGNNNDLDTAATANYPPYGVDFPDGPTGRFTNGRNIADFLGLSLSPCAFKIHISFI